MGMIRPGRTAAMAALLCLLAACGGKSTGSTTRPPPPPGTTTYTVSIPNTAIRAEGYVDGNDPHTGSSAARITVESEPFTSAPPLHMRWSFTARGVSNVWTQWSSYDTLYLEVAYVDPETLPDGEYDDTIQLEIAEDEAFARPLAGSPFKFTSAYVVHGSSAHVVPTMLAAPRTHLTHDVLDAAMSRPLHAIAMTSGAPFDALYLHDTITHAEKKLFLPKPATTLALSPDGRWAAVGHERSVTWVDLATLGQATPDVRYLPTPGTAESIVPDGRGAIHVFAEDLGSAALYSVDVVTGAVRSNGYGRLFGEARAGLHPSGDRVYSVDANGQYMGRFTVGDGELLISKERNDLFERPPCDRLWISRDGQRIYTGCGHTFAATPDVAEDMSDAGMLEISAPSGSASPPIMSLSDSADSAQVVFFDAGYCARVSVRPERCEALLRVNQATDGATVAAYRLPLIMLADGSAVLQNGAFVFHDADDKVFTLSRAINVDGVRAWYLDSPLVASQPKANEAARGGHRVFSGRMHRTGPGR